MIVKLREDAVTFWRRRPALWIALLLYCGFLLAIQGQVAPAIITFALLALPLPSRWQLTALLLFLLSTLLGWLLCREPQLPQEGWRGQGEVEIVSVAPSGGLFGKGWSYRGRLRHFTREGEEQPSSEVRRLPVYLSVTKGRPPADRDYLIEGTLLRKRRGYALKATLPWEPIPGSWSLAEWRRRQHERVESYFQQRMSNPEGATLLSGLLVGDFCDVQTLFDFGRLGLQHILAISGFHFSMIGVAFAWIFRLLLPRRLAAIALGLLLTGYFLVVGAGPATHRAWVAALVALGGVVLGRKCDGLNTLGVAGIAVLLWEPASCGSLGFQFSFAATAALLLYYRPVDSLLRHFFSSYPLGQVGEMRFGEQHLYLLLLLVRRALALLIAVHLVVVPMSLCFFHRFSLLGLAYNLLFPFLFSALILLLPWIALSDLLFGWGFGLVDGLVGWLLDLAHYAPPALDYVVRADWLSGWLVGGWLLILLGLRMKNKEVAPLEPLRL